MGRDDKSNSVDPRLFCFSNLDDDRAFDRSVMEVMGELQKAARSAFVSDRNVLRFNHGSRYVHIAREHGDKEPTMQAISVEHIIPFKDIAENDLSLIERSIGPVNESMERQFVQNMYGVISAGAEKVGNVVDAKQKSIPDSYVEMLSKIEFGVDRNGKVSLPEIHMAPETVTCSPEKSLN